MLLTTIKISTFAAMAVFSLTTSVNAISISLDGYRGFFPSDVDKFLQVHSVAFPFIKNQGQADSRISFYRSTATGMALVTTSGELLYTIDRHANSALSKKPGSFRIQFKDGKAAPAGRAKYNPLVNFYLGNKIRKINVNLPVYDTVVLGEVWPGINVALHTRDDRVGKQFAVRPGGDVSLINMQVSYAHQLKVHHDGKLVVFTAAGPIKFKRPNAYQIDNGRKVSVSIAYRINNFTYGFKVAGYDKSRALFIDPLIIDIDTLEN